jgi:hypothetical protein
MNYVRGLPNYDLPLIPLARLAVDLRFECSSIFERFEAPCNLSDPPLATEPRLHARTWAMSHSAADKAIATESALACANPRRRRRSI